jgi:hypothetical protein
MRAGKEGRAGSLRGRDRKGFKRFLEKDGVRAESQVGGLTKFADEGFGGDLPCRGGAHKDSIGTRANESACGGRERGIVSEPPKKRVGVQEQAQKSLPGFEFRLGERLEEFRVDLEFSFHASGFALPRFLAKRLKANAISTGDQRRKCEMSQKRRLRPALRTRQVTIGK